MKPYILIIGLLLPSALFAQADHTEAYYRQAVKKLDSMRAICPDSLSTPRIKELDSSPAANEYLRKLVVAAFRWEGEHCRDINELKARVEKVFALPLDTIQSISNRWGEDYLVWLYARRLLSPELQERFLINWLDFHVKEEWLSHARRYLSELEVYFPRSRYINEARAKVRALESQVEAGKKNPHILFRGPVHSLNELVAPYKGKVVYLDVWGTWCGPCREEMKYAAALKQHVDSSKVVFLYLDEDADEKDGQWREYVQMNNITGEHLRMNEQDIGVIWEALLPDSPLARTYPRFFIFGRNGKLVQANAKRPSDEEVLYNQLKEAIDAP